MSDGSAIVITYDGTDITSHVLFETASFESQFNAIPGSFEFTVKDRTRSLSFTSGKEVTLTIDGTTYFGGYLTQVSRTHAFDADDTTAISSYENRYWVLRGVDYNILFDKRVIRDTSNYLSMTNLTYPGTTMDGALLSDVLANYIDVPAGFDTTTYLDDTRMVNQWNQSADYATPAQGSKLRDLFSELSKWYGQIWYIDASKRFHFHSLERAESRWGFSDLPNNLSITTATSNYQGSTYGFREVEAIEDGSVLVNDALVWGGSGNVSSDVVFARAQNASSQSTYGRWQYGELRFGDLNIQDAVDARASAIVNGPPGTDAYGEQKGLRYPQWSFKFTWFASDVPKISTVRQHITPGQLVTIDMNVFGVTKLLPCRQIRVTFPGQGADGLTYVQFEGSFGLQPSDPISLWQYISTNQARVSKATYPVVTDGSTSTTYGAVGRFTPTPSPDGVTTVFDIPFGYISGTLQVYLNGLIQRPTTDFTESSPSTGGFTMTSAPVSTDTLQVICRTMSA